MLLNRMLRVMKLESGVFEEVEHDETATSQAMLVVIIANVLFGVGPMLLSFSMMGIIRGVIGGLLGWCAWAVMTFFIGTRLFAGKATIGEMLRVLGFATTPMCLGIVPILGSIVGGIWAIIAMVIAVRQGLDVSTGKAVATILIGLVAYIIVAIIISLVMGPAMVAAT